MYFSSRKRPEYRLSFRLKKVPRFEGHFYIRVARSPSEIKKESCDTNSQSRIDQERCRLITAAAFVSRECPKALDACQMVAQ